MGAREPLNVMKVLWACAELDLAFEHVDAGLHFGKVDEPGFREMNPNARVPVLNDDGFILWESNVIVRYLCYKHGLGTLYPTDVRQRARAEQWMDWQQTTVAPPLAWAFHGLVRGDSAFTEPSSMARAAAELDRVWSVLDAQLAERDYILGPQFSMADIPLGVAAWRWLALPIERAELAHVKAWQGRLAPREGFREYVAQRPG